MSDRNKAIFSLVYKLSKIDDNFDYRENKYLNDLANALKLSSEDTKEVILAPDKYKLIPPASEQERMMILYYILFAMKIDGKIIPQEENIVYQIGIQLGFRALMLKDMIEVMKKHLNKRLEPGILVSVIRKYLN